MPAGRRHGATWVVPAKTPNLNSPPEAPKHWGQVSPNRNEYHFDTMGSSSTCVSPHITDYWHQHGEQHWTYADLVNVARDILCFSLYGVRVLASISLGWNNIGRKQSKTPWKCVQDNVVVMQVALTSYAMLAGGNKVLDTMETKHDFQMERDMVDRTLHTLAKVCDFWETWHGSQTLCDTFKKSRPQQKLISAGGYITASEEIINASWSNFQHDSAAACAMVKRSLLPPALTLKDLTGGRTELSKRHWINTIDGHPAESDRETALQTISTTEN